MSYDFRLFEAEAGVDPLVTVQAELEKTEEINPGPPVPGKEARKRALAAVLLKANSALSVFQFGFDEIAKFEGISVEEARLRYRHIEINGADDGNGIQITLFDNGASLTVPYWHKDKKAESVFREIWGYLQLIQQTAGYHIYDPQLERVIHLASDLDDVIRRYLGVVKRLGI